jgi:mannose-6-phosphate isomerase-like protein (cupin superfamily)
MGYHVVDFDAIEPHPEHECDRRTLQAAVDLEHLGMSIYTAEPGEQIPQQYHYHDTQEELLYVIEGRMAVETPDGELTVGANEVFVAEPNAPHRAFNPADATGRLRVVAVGGPMIKDGHGYGPDE